MKVQIDGKTGIVVSVVVDQNPVSFADAMSVIETNRIQNLSKQLAFKIETHKVLCESWYVVNNGKRKLIRDIVKLECEIDDILDKMSM